MQIFTLTVLNIYQKYPTAKASQIANTLSVAPQMIKQARKELLRTNLIIKTPSEWYVTFAGRLALTKFDKEKAMESAAGLKEAVALICSTLDALPSDLENFMPMNKGMTNDSYIFNCRGKKYIYRLAGQGTDVLVDRHREYANYLALNGREISDRVVYHNAFTGTKISEFIMDSHCVCENDDSEIDMALVAVRYLHSCGIETAHSFDFFERINYYQVLCQSGEVVFFDSYLKYKAIVMQLLEKVDTFKIPACFCHIDFIPDNCMVQNGKVILIDWEYSGMQDPLVDVAMFCITTGFDKRKSDALLKKYLQREPTVRELFRFYTFLAAGSLTWSLWSEYKASQGVHFEGYTAQMNAICKKYSEKAFELIDEV